MDREDEVLNEELPTEEKQEVQEKRQKEIAVIRKIVRKKEEEKPETIEAPAEEAAIEEIAKTNPEPEAEAEELMNCPFCGKQIPAIAKHCPYCGKALGEEKGVKAGINKKWILAGAIALAALAVLLFAVPAIQKSSKYKNAMQLLNDGSYSEAAEVFRELEDYKDSGDYVTYCNALDAFSKGDLDKAISRFENIPELGDSGKYINYISGLQIISLGNDASDYSSAKDMFAAAEGLLDSEGMARYCEGVLSFLNEKDSDALSQLEELTESKTVKDEYLNNAFDIIRFLNAKAAFDKDDYSVLEEFRNVASTDNSLVCYKAEDYVNYIEGKQFYDQELFYSAVSRFNKCYGFKDAAELAESCHQERPSSGIIYRNTTSGSVSVTIYDTKDDEDMFVKIYDNNDVLVESLYIRDGASATAYFQGGKFRMAIAYAESEYWYGPNEAFGSMGTYQRLLLNGNDEYYNFPGGNSYTLKFNVSNGNVDHKSSNYGDF